MSTRPPSPVPATGRICKVHHAPVGGRWAQSLDGTECAPIGEILEWCAGNIRGRMFWMEVMFRNPKSPKHRWGGCPYQRHWPDEAPRYTFWFTKKLDAAKFVLFWK
jgi:hypothetical protein